jgi:DNA topoisomerase VI subunit B
MPSSSASPTTGGEPGRIDVSIEPAGEGWQVTIRDNGIGIPPENLQKIFDPFFTSKDVGKGMGLGLSITHQILQAHKALIEVDSRPGNSPASASSSQKPAMTRNPSPNPFSTNPPDPLFSNPSSEAHPHTPRHRPP